MFWTSYACWRYQRNKEGIGHAFSQQRSCPKVFACPGSAIEKSLHVHLPPGLARWESSEQSADKECLTINVPLKLKLQSPLSVNVLSQ
jgi:hypothetical protein